VCLHFIMAFCGMTNNRNPLLTLAELHISRNFLETYSVRLSPIFGEEGVRTFEFVMPFILTSEFLYLVFILTSKFLYLV
jgi:hypothetical protein